MISDVRVEPFECPCVGHMPWQYDECQCSQKPGYNMVDYFACIPSYDTGGNPNNGGVNTGGTITNPNNPANNDNSVAAIVGPNEGCDMPEEDLPYNIDGECGLSPYEVCLMNGNSQEVCDCVDQGNDLNICIINSCINEDINLLNYLLQFN